MKRLFSATAVTLAVALGATYSVSHAVNDPNPESPTTNIPVSVSKNTLSRDAGWMAKQPTGTFPVGNITLTMSADCKSATVHANGFSNQATQLVASYVSDDTFDANLAKTAAMADGQASVTAPFGGGSAITQNKIFVKVQGKFRTSYKAGDQMYRMFDLSSQLFTPSCLPDDGQPASIATPPTVTYSNINQVCIPAGKETAPLTISLTNTKDEKLTSRLSLFDLTGYRQNILRLTKDKLSSVTHDLKPGETVNYTLELARGFYGPKVVLESNDFRENNYLERVDAFNVESCPPAQAPTPAASSPAPTSPSPTQQTPSPTNPTAPSSPVDKHTAITVMPDKDQQRPVTLPPRIDQPQGFFPMGTVDFKTSEDCHKVTVKVDGFTPLADRLVVNYGGFSGNEHNDNNGVPMKDGKGEATVSLKLGDHPNHVYVHVQKVYRTADGQNRVVIFNRRVFTPRCASSTEGTRDITPPTIRYSTVTCLPAGRATVPLTISVTNNDTVPITGRFSLLDLTRSYWLRLNRYQDFVRQFIEPGQTATYTVELPRGFYGAQMMTYSDNPNDTWLDMTEAVNVESCTESGESPIPSAPPTTTPTIEPTASPSPTVAPTAAPTSTPTAVSPAALRAADWIVRNWKATDWTYDPQSFYVGVRAEAAIALAATGTHRDIADEIVKSLEPFVQSGFADKPGYAGRIALAVMALGEDPTNFAGMDLISTMHDVLKKNPRADDIDDEDPNLPYVLLALLRYGDRVPQASINELIKDQDPGGAFGYHSAMYPDARFILRGYKTGVIMNVLALLNEKQPSAQVTKSLNAVKDWVANHQEYRGTWEGDNGGGIDWKNDAVSGIVSGLSALGQTNPRAIAWLTSEMNRIGDGGIARGPNFNTADRVVTIHATLALAGKSLTTASFRSSAPAPKATPTLKPTPEATSAPTVTPKPAPGSKLTPTPTPTPKPTSTSQPASEPPQAAEPGPTSALTSAPTDEHAQQRSRSAVTQARDVNQPSAAASATVSAPAELPTTGGLFAPQAGKLAAVVAALTLAIAGRFLVVRRSAASRK